MVVRIRVSKTNGQIGGTEMVGGGGHLDPLRRGQYGGSSEDNGKRIKRPITKAHEGTVINRMCAKSQPSSAGGKGERSCHLNVYHETQEKDGFWAKEGGDHPGKVRAPSPALGG